MKSNNKVRQILKRRYLESRGYKNRDIKLIQAKRQVLGFTFSLMPLVIMGIFVFYSFYLGLTLMGYEGSLNADLSTIKEGTFKRNLEVAFKTDPLIGDAIKNTFTYMLVTTAIGLFGSLFIAFILNTGKIKGKKTFLTIYFLPQVTSFVASTIILYNVLAGPSLLNLFEDESNALWLMIIAGLWSSMATQITTFNTAFTTLGDAEYEAASLDGAKGFTKFFKITIPALAPIISYALMTSIMSGLGIFGQAFILISKYGIANEHVITISTLGYWNIFQSNNLIKSNVGAGMIQLLALGVTIFVLSMISNKIQPIDGKK